MQKVLPITLILLLFMNLFGFYGAFFVSRYEIRVQAHRQLEKSIPRQLVKLRFTRTQLKNVQVDWWNEEEIKLQGRFYDIKYKETAGDYVTVWALEDKPESELLQNFMAYVQQQSSAADNDNADSVIKFIQQEFIPAYIICHSFTYSTAKYWQYPTSVTGNGFVNPLYSPPDSFFS